jgi:hypothetical protein
MNSLAFWYIYYSAAKIFKAIDKTYKLLKVKKLRNLSNSHKSQKCHSYFKIYLLIAKIWF